MTYGGYHHGYLHIRLDGHQLSVHRPTLTDATLRRTLGGVGLGVHLLLNHQGPTADLVTGPLAFVFSPLVGSPVTTSAKFAVVCKSPLTFRLNDALASSGFAISGKATGNDALMITGAAAEWSVLVIDDEHVSLDTAQDLLGKTTAQTEAALRARYGDDFEFAVIGPAGENQVRFASLSHDGRHAGRGGAGAVLGAKRLKAIAVRGSKKCHWAQPDALVKRAKYLSQASFGPATAKYRELGTASNLLAFNRLNTLPTRNFQQSTFESAEQIAPETLQQTHERTRKSCRACTIGCEHLYALDKSAASTNVRLEYENLFALGPLCGIADPSMVLAASKRCDEWGMDTISAGGTIAFAMECVERELLDAPWLRFGDGHALLRAIDEIGNRQGLGEQLAQGSRWLSEQLGGPALDFACHVKGLELPGYEPRTLQTMALGFAVGARGADHNRSSAYEVDFSPEEDRRNISAAAVGKAIAAEDRAVLMDSLILCKFLRHIFDDIWSESAELLQLATGWDITAEELHRCVRRIMDDKKRFNILCGWSPKEDTLPARFFDDTLPNDPAKLDRGRLRQLIQQYNEQRGWSADGFLLDTSTSPPAPLPEQK